MRLIVYGVFVFWINCLGYGMKTAFESHKNSTITNCLVEIVALLGVRKISIEYSNNFEGIASAFISSIQIPVVINLQENHKKMGIDTRIFDDVKIILNNTAPERVINTTLWNGDTRFFVFSEKQNIQTILEKFWKSMIIKVFVLIQEDDEVLVYSFEPYRNINCKTIEVVLADKYLENKFKQNGMIFKDQYRIKNVNGCPLNVTINDVKPDLFFEGENGGNTASSIGGFEGNLMKEVAKSLNFTPIYKKPNDGINWGWIRPSPHGTVGEVYTGISELAVGMIGPLIDRHETLDSSLPYNLAECVTYAVPRGLGAKNADWISLFVLEFHSFTWALIIFSFFLTCITIWRINKLSKINWFHNKTELAMAIFSSCFGAPIKIPNFKLTKTLAICWIIFCFITTAAYKASMGSKLTVPSQDPDIYTFNELMHLDIEINGFQTMYQLMSFRDWIYTTMRRRYKFVNYTSPYALTRIASTGAEAHLRHKTTLMYYILIDPKVRSRVKILDDCVIFYFPVIMLRKYSPFTFKVNQVISHLEEFGIMPMWRSKYEYKPSVDVQPFYKLTFNQMYGMYLVLLFGYLIAIVAFVSEISYKMYIQRQGKKK